MSKNQKASYNINRKKKKTMAAQVTQEKAILRVTRAIRLKFRSKFKFRIRFICRISFG